MEIQVKLVDEGERADITTNATSPRGGEEGGWRTEVRSAGHVWF